MNSNDSYWFSIVIITFNEAENIQACLESIAGLTDDILVLDSYSTDQTKQLASAFPVRFLERSFTNYGDQKNWGNEHARYNYVLSIDADERLSEKLKQSIQNISGSKSVAYQFNRKTNYCGHWVRYGGWYPDTKVRLFRKDLVSWNSAKIHETLILPRDIVPIHLPGDLLHYSFRSEEAHLDQIRKFNRLKAEVLFDSGKRVTGRGLWIRPMFKFLKIYLFKLGILDGKVGYQIARNSAYGERYKWEELSRLNAPKP